MAKQNGNKPAKRVSDVLGGRIDRSGKIDIDSILDTELILEDAEFTKGKHGEFVVLQLRGEGDKTPMVTQTGGKVVCEQVHTLLEKEALPLLCTIEKVDGSWYRLT